MALIAIFSGAPVARRRVRLAHGFDAAARVAVLERLRRVPGMLAAVFAAPDAVALAYDLSRLDYLSVLEALRGAGALPAPGLWQRLLRDIRQFLDSGARERLDGSRQFGR